MDKDIKFVFLKEFRELMRDRRVRSSALIGPFLMVFMMMMVMGTAINATTQSRSTIHVVRANADTQVIENLKSDNSTVEFIDSLSEGKQLLAKGKAAVVAEFSAPAAGDNQQQVNVIYDGKAERSQMAEKTFQDAIDKTNKQKLDTTLQSRGISTNVTEQLKMAAVDVNEKHGANEILLSMVPYLVVFLAFVGGVSAASDLVAGEKERNTLETLLISPVPRTKIVIGKFMALGSICLLSSVSGLAGILVAASGHLPGTSAIFPGGSGVSAGAVGSILLVMIPTVALFASVLIAVSSYAKNTREAQTYLSLGSIVVALPTVLSQFLGFTELGTTRWINMVPILNASNAVRSALMGTLDATSLGITAGVSTAIALIAITIAVKLCNREQVLLRI